VSDGQINIDPAAIRSAMLRRGVPPAEAWRLTIRGGPGGGVLRRALNGRPIEREAADKLAAVLGVKLDEITAGGP